MRSSKVCPDDLSIQVRVRQSPRSDNPIFNEAEEMNCILRRMSHSNQRNRHESDNNGDSVLIMSPVKNNIESRNIMRQERASSFSLVPLKRNGNHSSDIHSRKMEEVAEDVSRRFHSFGSIPLSKRDRSDDLLLRSNSITRKKSDKCSSTTTLTLPPAIHRKYSGTERSTKQLRARSGRNRPASDSISSNDAKALTHTRSTASTSSNTTHANHYFISTSDITLIDLSGKHAYSKGNRYRQHNPTTFEKSALNPISVTTISSGYFEFTFLTKNAHDIMVAFLRSSLPKRHFISNKSQFSKTEPSSQSKTTNKSTSKHPKDPTHGGSINTQNDNAGIHHLDMDNFTAKEMEEWIKQESISERWIRRANMLSSRVNEITIHLTECVPCTCGEDSLSTFDSQTYVFRENNDNGTQMFSFEGVDSHNTDTTKMNKNHMYIGMDVIPSVDTREGIEIGFTSSDEKKEYRNDEIHMECLKTIVL